jgi:hypothetical protein
MFGFFACAKRLAVESASVIALTIMERSHAGHGMCFGLFMVL